MLKTALTRRFGLLGVSVAALVLSQGVRAEEGRDHDGKNSVEQIKTAYRKDPTLQGRQAAEIGAAVLQRVLAGAEGKLELAGPTPPAGLRGEGIRGLDERSRAPRRALGS